MGLPIVFTPHLGGWAYSEVQSILGAAWVDSRLAGIVIFVTGGTRWPEFVGGWVLFQWVL
jgi:hypothetical protein